MMEFYHCLCYIYSYETSVSEDDIIRIHDDHGNTIELLGSGGQYLSASSVRSGRYPNPVTNIPRLRKMNVNEDDIFLCAAKILVKYFNDNVEKNRATL
uniref:Uncharacterized protein n=1 Tax=Magallana gigas TaxID=29159 RepID=A0A8W8NGZ2_MAGGI